ncbi:hypothetical protein MKZ38_004636 [Zalerion maritima]|uniref:FAD-binding domain-containing protein n=1 Tax=Zalerion maritima TaxID=339359 RepID=A0AAD5RMB6_9PEZI|nr:hypothetical protein MKZ38_004636 [Zalerion maritima]
MLDHGLSQRQSASDVDITTKVDDTIPMAGSERTIFEFGDFDHSSIPLEEERWPVIIIGSSMVGMTLGVLLGYHGVGNAPHSTALASQIHPLMDVLPKLQSQVRVLRPPPFHGHPPARSALPSAFRRDTPPAWPRPAWSHPPQESDPDRVAQVTPAVQLWLTRNMFEPLLRESAEDFGVVQQFGEAVVHYDEGPGRGAQHARRSASPGMDRGFWAPAGEGRNDFQPDSVTAADAEGYFFDAAGLNHGEIPVEVESINYWSIAGFNTERMSSKMGRVFIAGDAAHLMPPTGGMGGNTGVQDVYNLAWKLAYVLSRKASPKLLKTYDEERQPVNGFTMRQAYSRFQHRVARTQPDEPELPDIVCDIGYRYPTGAAIPARSEWSPSPPLYEDPYSPLVTAGSRLPHVDIVRCSGASQHISTLDLVKQNFVLIAVDSSNSWIRAAIRLEGLRVDAYSLNEQSTPFRDPPGKARETLKVAEGEALLVRPDGYIAWRAGKVEDDGRHAQLLKEALEAILQKRFT